MSPFLAEARRIVDVQQGYCDRETARRRGLAGGSADIMRPEPVAVVAERLAAEHERRLAFQASPRGRFLRAVRELLDLGEEQAPRLLALYDRRLSALNGPLSAESLPAIGDAIATLNGIVGKDARAAIDALSDLLREDGPQLGKAA